MSQPPSPAFASVWNGPTSRVATRVTTFAFDPETSDVPEVTWEGGHYFRVIRYQVADDDGVNRLTVEVERNFPDDLLSALSSGPSDRFPRDQLSVIHTTGTMGGVASFSTANDGGLVRETYVAEARSPDIPRLEITYFVQIAATGSAPAARFRLTPP